MRSSLTFRLIVLAALLFSLIRVLIVSSAHVGPVEWLVAALLLVVLVVATLQALRRAG